MRIPSIKEMVIDSIDLFYEVVEWIDRKLVSIYGWGGWGRTLHYRRWEHYFTNFGDISHSHWGGWIDAVDYTDGSKNADDAARDAKEAKANERLALYMKALQGDKERIEKEIKAKRAQQALSANHIHHIQNQHQINQQLLNLMNQQMQQMAQSALALPIGFGGSPPQSPSPQQQQKFAFPQAPSPQQQQTALMSMLGAAAAQQKPGNIAPLSHGGWDYRRDEHQYLPKAQTGPFIGYRLWHTLDGFLVPLVHNTGNGIDELPKVDPCWSSPVVNADEKPSQWNTNGLYACNLDFFKATLGGEYLGDKIMGRIEGFGVVAAHEFGFRASKALIEKLAVPSPLASLAPVLAERYQCPVKVVYDEAGMIEFLTEDL